MKTLLAQINKVNNMIENKVWVIDDDQAMRWVLERAFQKAEILLSTPILCPLQNTNRYFERRKSWRRLLRTCIPLQV